MATEGVTAAEQHRRAGEAAEAATLWDEAVVEYEAALSAMGNAGGGSPADEAALLTALGRCYWNMSEARTAWRTLRRAIALCRDHGDAAGMARATVEILRIWGPPDRQRTMAREALDALDEREPWLRAHLLLRLRWGDEDPAPKFEQAMAIAEEHGFEDLLAVRVNERAWQAFDEGRLDEGLALQRQAHETYARFGAYEPAAGAMRGMGFGTLELGRIDEGEALALECVAYARKVHLRFTEQLAMMDAVGAAYARCDYARCEALLAEIPGNTDFRGDLYRMWTVELRGDSPGALRMMVDPERGGGAPTAMSQTHGAAAGVLFRAGNVEAARSELTAWYEIASPQGALWPEAPALFECIAGLGDDEMVRAVHAAFGRSRERKAWYATLQGRALAPAHGAVCMRLGLVDEAEQVYRGGLAWCERERVPLDAGLCLLGLAEIAEARGDALAAGDAVGRARALFQAHGARMYVERCERVSLGL